MRLAEIRMPPVRHAWYWHGTNNTAGQQIMREGFRVDALRPRGKNYLPPVYAATYFTPRFAEALRSATSENKQRYGWLFAVQSSSLGEIEIDEDEIGIAVRSAYQKTETPNGEVSEYMRKFDPIGHLSWSDSRFRNALLSLANSHLPADLIANLREYNKWSARWFSDTGRILNRVLPVEMKMKMIAAGCHVAHLEPIVPEQAWRFDPKRRTDLHNASLRNPLTAVLQQYAERMR